MMKEKIDKSSLSSSSQQKKQPISFSIDNKFDFDSHELPMLFGSQNNDRKLKETILIPQQQEQEEDQKDEEQESQNSSENQVEREDESSEEVVLNKNGISRKEKQQQQQDGKIHKKKSQLLTMISKSGSDSSSGSSITTTSTRSPLAMALADQEEADDDLSSSSSSSSSDEDSSEEDEEDGGGGGGGGGKLNFLTAARAVQASDRDQDRITITDGGDYNSDSEFLGRPQSKGREKQEEASSLPTKLQKIVSMSSSSSLTSSASPPTSTSTSTSSSTTTTAASSPALKKDREEGGAEEEEEVEDEEEEETSGSPSRSPASASASQAKEKEQGGSECPLQCKNGGLCSREDGGSGGGFHDSVSTSKSQSSVVLAVPLESSSSSSGGGKLSGGKPRCLCRLGYHGELCEIEDGSDGEGYTSGLFRGQSWVAFPVLHDAYMSDQISLEFRPESANGIIMVTGEREDLTGDFLALYVHDSFLEFRFDCGSGSGMVRSSQPVNLQQWNRANIVRRRWDGWMQLNDGPFTQGRSKGLFSRITFRQPVFIGGAGNITFGGSVDSSSTSNNNNSSANNNNNNGEPASAGAEEEESKKNNNNGNKLEVSETDLETESPTAAAAVASVTTGESSEPKRNSSSSSSSSSSQDEIWDMSTALPILKKTGGFRGCIRNLVINDRTYRFGLEPAGDAVQGLDIENCNEQGVCDLLNCQHGGQCIVQKDENPSCLCPLGFTGSLCQTSLDLQIPSFNGSSYLKYGGLGLSRVLSWLELEVVVKPDAMDGLIMYNGYKTDGMGDFISLVIDQGYFEFALDLGTGTAIIRSDYPVVLGEWHRILISRTSRLISMRIDNQSPLTTMTPGAFTQLSLPHNLFLGGIPDPQWLSPKVKVHGGFSGCIQKLVINEKPLRIMGAAMSGVNLENCAHPCLENPCDHGVDAPNQPKAVCVPELDSFKCHCPLGYRDLYCQTRMDKNDIITAPKLIGDSYLRFTSPRIIKRISGSRLNLTFRLRTSLSRGLILWAGRKLVTSASDFISVGLRNGFIHTSFNLGSGQTTIAYNYTTVHDGQWHFVRLLRNEQEASISVDDGPPVIGVAPGKLRQLNINDGLFLGGLDDPRRQSINRYAEGLVGCITDLVLGNDYRVSLLQEASEGRNVDYCD